MHDSINRLANAKHDIRECSKIYIKKLKVDTIYLKGIIYNIANHNKRDQSLLYMYTKF